MALFGGPVAAAIRSQALQFCRIGPHNPALPPTVLLACPYHATLDPVQQAAGRPFQPVGQLPCPPFIRTELLAGGAMPVRGPESQLAPQRLDTGNTPAISAAQRWKAVARELAGNGVQRPAGMRQFLDAGTEAGVITPVGVAGKGPYQHAFRLAAPSPGHPHPHLLARALCRDRHLLDHPADQLFSVRIRRRGGVPPRRKSGGELANRRAFLTRQDARLLLEEAVLLFPPRRLRAHPPPPGA